MTANRFCKVLQEKLCTKYAKSLIFYLRRKTIDKVGKRLDIALGLAKIGIPLQKMAQK